MGKTFSPVPAVYRLCIGAVLVLVLRHGNLQAQETDTANDIESSQQSDPAVSSDTAAPAAEETEKAAESSEPPVTETTADHETEQKDRKRRGEKKGDDSKGKKEKPVEEELRTIEDLVDKKPTLAVYDLQCAEIKDNFCDSCTEYLTHELTATKEFTMITRYNMHRLLRGKIKEKDEQKVATCMESNCASIIGKTIDADYVVVGRITRNVISFKLDFQLVNAKSKTVVYNYKKTHSGKKEDIFLELIPQAAQYMAETVAFEQQGPKIDRPMNPLLILGAFALGAAGSAILTAVITSDDAVTESEKTRKVKIEW